MMAERLDGMISQDHALLDVRNLRTYFFTEDGIVKAVDGVDLTVYRGEVLGLVGESGCGKTVTSLSILRLMSSPGRIVDGSIVFDGQELLELSETEMVQVRGRRIAMILQQPQSALNPVLSVGDQLGEVLQVHQGLGKDARTARSVELLETVGIPDPERCAGSYAHELSGGMAQRVMIALALACGPELLIADEPTTALDVTIQAQILDLMRVLRQNMDTAIILITHDLGVIAEMAERVAVMYGGVIVEQADVETLFARPLHPYTQGLMGSIPSLSESKDWLEVIPGSVPDLIDLPAGCRFAPRCRKRVDHELSICMESEPELKSTEVGHTVRCWLFQDSPDHSAPKGALSSVR
jgi:oligopeptide/dipeptide ABC transporter ATP-binding protein